jgi:hypothetical protein
MDSTNDKFKKRSKKSIQSNINDMVTEKKNITRNKSLSNKCDYGKDGKDITQLTSHCNAPNNNKKFNVMLNGTVQINNNYDYEHNMIPPPPKYNEEITESVNDKKIISTMSPNSPSSPLSPSSPIDSETLYKYDKEMLDKKIRFVEDMLNKNTPGLEFELDRHWILWVKNHKKEWNENTVKPYAAFRTIAGFWTIYNSIEWNGIYNYILMEYGYIPILEKSYHQNGGTCRIFLNKYKCWDAWKIALLECIGATHQCNENIYGISISLNTKIGVLKYWTKNTYKQFDRSVIHPEILEILDDSDEYKNKKLNESVLPQSQDAITFTPNLVQINFYSIKDKLIKNKIIDS